MSRVTGDNLDSALRSAWPGVRAYVASLLIGRRDEVDDVMQETALFVWTNREKLGEVENFTGWLFRIAYFKTRSRLRDLSRDRHTMFSEQLLEKLAEEAELQFSDIDESRLLTLAGCIEKAPPDDRAILVWRYVDNRPLTELADRLGRTSASLHQRISRLRKTLRQCMDKNMTPSSTR